MELLTAAQMRAIEQEAIESGAVTGLELMERAGQGVVDAIFEEWPDLAPVADGRGPAPGPPPYLEQEEEGRRAIVLCGPGNNGGDGFVVARLLHEAGWEVEVFFYGDPARLPPDARVNYKRWVEIGAAKPLSRDAFHDAADASIYVDTLFGTGLKRAPEGELRDLLRDLAGANGEQGFYQPRLVAVDAPTGLDLDSGRALDGQDPSDGRRFSGLGAVPECRLTVTFELPKLGHFLQDGPRVCGKLKIFDLGLEKQGTVFRDPVLGLPVPRKSGRGVPLATLVGRHHTVPRTGIVKHMPTPDFGKTRAHKFSYGHALVLSGTMGKTGAARLAARGALRVGAGLVTVAAPGSAMLECAAQLTAIMLRRCDDGNSLAEMLGDTRINALCLGPGLGIGARETGLVSAALDASGPVRGVVLDADALTLLAEDQVLFAELHNRCVLTPHAGEFARLFPDLAEKLAEPAKKGPAYSKVDATREAAARAGCTVLFKGPDTVIAHPKGKVSIHSSAYERAAPWLATAGSGDVLAGIITGLLARGYPVMQAAEWGAWLHVEAARAFGPGLIAEDLPEMLPQVFRDLET